LNTSYYNEITWRIIYILSSFIFCFLIGIYYGEYIRAFCLEPWYNEWEMDTIQYIDPQEIWYCYLWLSFIFSFWFVYPFIGIHLIFFISNSLFYSELKNLYLTWFISCFLLWFTWYRLIKYQIIGLLRDISHFDEDINLVYVPNLKTYVNNWFNFIFVGRLLSQIPLIWLYRNYIIYYPILYNRFNRSYLLMNDFKPQLKTNIYANRVGFTIFYIIPSFLSAIILYDDLMLQIIWVILFRIMYLTILYLNRLYYNYIIKILI